MKAIPAEKTLFIKEQRFIETWCSRSGNAIPAESKQGFAIVTFMQLVYFVKTPTQKIL